jgi:hypothetical protein
MVSNDFVLAKQLQLSAHAHGVASFFSLPTNKQMSLLQAASATIIGATNQLHTKFLYAEKTTIEGDAIVGGDLAVTGDASVGGDLAVTGDASVGGDLAVTGDASVGGDLTVTGTAHSVIGIAWVNNYVNLVNNVQNYIPFDTVLLNNATNVFALANSGAVGVATCARVFVQVPGIYEVISQMHFYDQTGNASMIVRLTSATGVNAAMTDLTLLSDEKFAENVDDRTLNATVIVQVAAPLYLAISVEPSANAPFPSGQYNTPPRIWIKKL